MKTKCSPLQSLKCLWVCCCSGENLLMAIWLINQIRVMGPESYRIQSVEVTDFDTNRKPICNFLLVINTNLLSCTVSKPIICQILASDRGVPHFNTLTGGDPLKISGSTLPLQKLEWLSYQTLKTARSYLHSSGQNTGMWQKDRQTDRQNHSGYYSSLHCKQCEHTVKTL